MSTSAITSGLLSQITSSSSTANQFASDLNQVASDLQSGNMSAAQQDYVTLSTDALDGTGSTSATTGSSGITTSLLSNIASSSSSSDSFVSELNQLGADLDNSDVTASQEDMLTLSSTALNAASASSASSTSSSTASATVMAGQPPSAALQTDIRAIIEAMDSGVTSAANSAMAQLASDAQNSPGTNYFKEVGETSGSSSSSSSTSSAAATPDTVTALLQSLDSAQTSVSSLVASATSSNS